MSKSKFGPAAHPLILVQDRLGSNNNSVLNEIGKIQQAMILGQVKLWQYFNLPFSFLSRPLRMFLHKLTRLFQNWRTYLLDLQYFMTGGSQRIESSPATWKESRLCPHRWWWWLLANGAVGRCCLNSLRFDERTEHRKECTQASSRQRILLADRCHWATGEDGSNRSQNAGFGEEEREATAEGIKVKGSENGVEGQGRVSKACFIPYPWIQGSRPTKAESQAGLDQAAVQCFWLLPWGRRFPESCEEHGFWLPEPHSGLPECYVDRCGCRSQWCSVDHRRSPSLHRGGKFVLHLFRFGSFHSLHGLWREESLPAGPVVCLRLPFSILAYL